MKAVDDLVRERFWQKVDKRGTDECWPWLGYRAVNGYGHLQVNKVKYSAHRLSFYIAHNRWPDECACHHCDNRPCVNPSHLFEGTHADNQRDKKQKGRTPCGEKQRLAKLRESDIPIVRMLLSIGCMQHEIGQRYGVSQAVISAIKVGKTWKHIPIVETP